MEKEERRKESYLGLSSLHTQAGSQLKIFSVPGSRSGFEGSLQQCHVVGVPYVRRDRQVLKF